ncbi:fatty acid desaturase [Mesorhizobium sp. ANAO-SY3R2]|uniref:fatty acid desaturase n=1 Tax=Mesorhizobium sp. ANAO-SY3R2 TaxID=3166644 RepID=UPI00366EFCF9
MAKRGNKRGTTMAVEWPTVFLIVACYGSWLVAGLVIWPAWPVIALAVMTLTVALQSSLVHEVLHGHPTRNAHVNEALVSLPIGLVWPYRRFKALHLRHHADERLTDPLDDPESYYCALWQHEGLPEAMRLMLRINNTMAGRFVIGPLLSSVGFILGDFRAIRAGNKAIRTAWILHGAGLLIVLPLVHFGFGLPLWLYVLGPVWFGQSLIAIRTFAEHQWSEHPEGRTIIVERSPLSLLFLNNNLHFVHHKSPTVAWYRLPALFRERRGEWLRMNKGYAYPNYFALVRAYAFRVKEPVVHPVLRRAPEPGRAFAPRIRARNVNGLGTAPVPAEPPKE